MKVAVACDHAGFDLKQQILPFLKKNRYVILDLGTHNRQPVDYPDFAVAIAQAIRQGRSDRGILICGSGVGASVAANKCAGIRAALAHDSYSAHQGVEHDDANVLCLGARVVGEELAKDLCLIFLKARFSGQTRHKRRLAKIEQIENSWCHSRGSGNPS